MVDALNKELELRAGYVDEPIDTIYFGGGTPSLLLPDEIAGLLATVSALFTVRPDAEVTLEANPDDLSPQKLLDLRSTGINRLSIGIQSFDDTILRFLNRAHDREAALGCIPDARNAGFDNVSLDLIYAIPGQTDLILASDIRTALGLQPEHISAYSLTIEEKTVFGKWATRGKIVPTPDDYAAQHLTQLIDALESDGYERYEVSNFAKPGFYSKHNSSYWRGIPYLGIGPGAHSYNLNSRQANISNNAIYLKELAVDRVPATVEVLSETDKINDYLLTTLRTCWGTSLTKLRNDFGFDLEAFHGLYLRQLVDEQLAEISDGHLTLTRKGMMVADKISSDLFVTAHN